MALFDPTPAVIGHRGFGRGTVEYGERSVTENTVESYQAAVEAGARWVEVDAQRTADDDLVVRHDPTTAGGEFLIEHTAARLREQGIPSLREVLAMLPTTVGVNIDVKTVLEDAVDTPDRRTGALLAEVLAAEAGRRPLFVSSFDPALLLYLKNRLPDLPVGLLGWVNFPLRHAVAAAANLGFQAVGLHTGSFTLNRIEGGPVHRPLEYSVDIAHRAGLAVIAWCPKPEDVPRFAAAGVDGLVVNDIPGTLTVLDEGRAAAPMAREAPESATSMGASAGAVEPAASSASVASVGPQGATASVGSTGSTGATRSTESSASKASEESADAAESAASLAPAAAGRTQPSAGGRVVE